MAERMEIVTWEVLERTLLLLRVSDQWGLPRPMVHPWTTGGVRLEWLFPNQHVEVALANTGKFSLFDAGSLFGDKRRQEFDAYEIVRAVMLASGQYR